MNLTAKLKRMIEARGPLGVNEYMALCLHDTEHGYYATRPAIGPEGDFITAPVISQMFGELIGLWAAEVWRGLGPPAAFRLVEIGPGDGALMEDVLRSTRVAPGFLDAAEVWLVEPSPPLRELQRARLSQGRNLRWAESLADVPGGAPLIILGNEVLDCMPARQFQRTGTGWAERKVGLDADGELVFVLRPATVEGAPDVPVGTIVEHSPRQAMFAGEVARRVRDDGGCALFIDYGRTGFEPDDTLQALRRHEKVPPLAAPGECDLTMWADFDMVGGAARAEGAAVAGPVSQATFLGRLGLEFRAARLSRLRPDQAATLARQVHRLIGPSQMGELFKAIAIFRPGQPTPPGFEGAA